MECEIVDAATLSQGHRERWMSMVGQQPSFDAPAFYPEFVCGLAEHIPHCKVAILRQGGSLLGYVAFQQEPGARAGRPIPMCDYQPIIIEPGFTLDAREIVRALGLKSWIFENVLAQELMVTQPTTLSVSLSPRAVMPDGYEAYRSGLAAAGKSVRNLQTKLRLLERDHGKVEFVLGAADETALTRLLQFKAQRYALDGQFPPFVPETLAYFHGLRTGRLTGSLSILKAGDHEVAWLFCLKAGTLLYYWFPTYDPKFQRYSPGLLSTWLQIQALPTLGCDVIDFGPGGEGYKEYFANRHIEVRSGEIHASVTVAATRRLFGDVERTIRASAVVQRYLKPAVQTLKGMRPND